MKITVKNISHFVEEDTQKSKNADLMKALVSGIDLMCKTHQPSIGDRLPVMDVVDYNGTQEQENNVRPLHPVSVYKNVA